MLTIAENLSADDRAQLDAMRAADNEPEVQADTGGSAQPSQPSQQDPAQPGESAGEERAPQEQKMVDIRALHESRAREKEYREQVAESNRKMQLLEERTNLLLQQHFNRPQEQPQPQAPAIPDMATDPVGHIVARLDQTQQRVDQFGQGSQQQQQAWTQQQQQAQVLQNFVMRAQALENEFKIETPDYEAAFTHLNQVRGKELAKIGIRDPGERMRAIQQQNLIIADIAMQNGQNPAQVLYELAQDRGYAPARSPAEQEQAAEPEQVPNGMTDRQRLDTLAAGQQQARSIGNMRGAAPPPLTAQRLLEMDGDEFMKMIKTPAGKAALGA